MRAGKQVGAAVLHEMDWFVLDVRRHPTRSSYGQARRILNEEVTRPVGALVGRELHSALYRRVPPVPAAGAEVLDGVWQVVCRQAYEGVWSHTDGAWIWAEVWDGIAPALRDDAATGIVREVHASPLRRFAASPLADPGP